jgi:hypothetical protein
MGTRLILIQESGIVLLDIVVVRVRVFTHLLLLLLFIFQMNETLEV